MLLWRSRIGRPKIKIKKLIIAVSICGLSLLTISLMMASTSQWANAKLTALKLSMKHLPDYKFKLESGNYHANMVVEPVEFVSGQASKVTTYQYAQKPSVIHRSVIELSYDVASQNGLENEVVSDLVQAINYWGYNG